MWNFDLDIGAMLVVLVLIVYYLRRKALPLHRNRLFLVMMLSAEGIALADIAASYMISHSGHFSVNQLYAVNMLYYLLVAMNPVTFFFYCVALTGHKSRNKRFFDLLINIPVFVIVFIVLTIPASGMVFSIEPDGSFVYRPGRLLLLGETVLYLLLGLGFVMIKGKKGQRLRRRLRIPLFIYVGIVLLGCFAQSFILERVSVVSLSLMLGILVMFLNFQNPDFYRDTTTSLLSDEGLKDLLTDDRIYGVARRVAEVAFENYDELLSVYGDTIMRQVLEQIGQYLRVTFPKSGIFYVHRGRFVIMRNLNHQPFERPFEKIKERCQRPFSFENGELYLNPCFAHSEEEFSIYGHEELEQAMIIAIEKALRIGKGAVVDVDEEIDQKARRIVKINRALERAVQGQGLEVFYQPIYSTADKRVTSAEALIRIRDEELGLIFPDEFIWKAEENSSILILGQIVFEKVCEFIKTHDMEKLGLSYIEVNLSPVQCMREQLAEEFKRTVARYEIDPMRINLEITESSNTSSDIIQKNMEELSEYGMTFSLDDYGTGFSNLVNVLNMPLHIVKIDKSIVWSYFDKKNQMLSHVMDLFKDSHLEIVAEGVETLEMVNTLTRMGCDYLQGYYFSKPINERDFLAYLHAV